MVKLRGRCEYRLKKHWLDKSEPLDLETVVEVPIRSVRQKNVLMERPEIILDASSQPTL